MLDLFAGQASLAVAVIVVVGGPSVRSAESGKAVGVRPVGEGPAASSHAMVRLRVIKAAEQFLERVAECEYGEDSGGDETQSEPRGAAA